MHTIIGVRFKQAGKVYYFTPGKLDIHHGDKVIVETSRGMECGTTVIGPREVSDDAVTPPLKVVHRLANESDIHRVEENHEKEKEAYGICEKKIAAHGLPMKLVDVEYTFDMNKIIFYFTADGRIDFRELVKDLASVFRTRIELRQIGVRDEAKLMGGIGCCGRPLCCATFLGEFAPVSIRMAKDQNLSLNPTKISGICGRLMCCLKYENDGYCNGSCSGCHQKVHKVQAPKQGSRVVSVDGEGKVISLNQQRRTATILLDNSRTIVASWEDVVEQEEEETVASGAEETEELIANIEKNEEEPEERPQQQRPMRPRRPRNERRNNEDYRSNNRQRSRRPYKNSRFNNNRSRYDRNRRSRRTEETDHNE